MSRRSVSGRGGELRGSARFGDAIPPIFAENMRQMHPVRGGGKAALAANVAVCA